VRIRATNNYGFRARDYSLVVIQTSRILFAQAGFVLLWSSGFIGARFGLEHVETFTFLFLRYALVTLVLMSISIVLYHSKKIPWKYVADISLIGILAHAMYLSTMWLAFTLGATAGTAALVGALQPIITGVVARRALGETIESNQWTGLYIGLAAVMIIVFNGMILGGSAIAYLLLLTSVACLTVASLHQRSLETSSSAHNLPLIVNIAIQSTASTLVLGTLAWQLENTPVVWHRDFVFALLWLALIVSLAGFAMYCYLLQHRPATQVASLTYLTVPATMLMSYVAFGESLTGVDVFGFLLAAFGVKLAHGSSCDFQATRKFF